MRKHVWIAAGFVSLALTAGNALAQVSKYNCTNNGPNLPEPLGDREGHFLLVAAGSCVIEGGVLDGTVVSQNTIWDNDKGVVTILSADGVARKPGSVAVYKVTGGTLSYIMQDGKPAGWTASGKGVYTLAVGGAAALAGKSYSWTARATGPRTYSIESKLD
jgi:hypothetical protein